ncbi:BID domain-containing T4SS effector [Bartonella krasnovii]|uniref:BID domain-containing T4SS effector n=1 Tax=Bartonella krasnovii TaxID=2267275 RepID=UPI001F4CCE92|nr:BID domain-containing T4SS effector [Bartonella krasnovii]UNF44978.1 BID domain-containing T4SS effector [Bartonella krasnovii]
MKKHQPHQDPQNQEPLYATVNKPNRGNQRGPNPEEEVLYASVSSIDPSKVGRHQQRREDPETDYTEVTLRKREEDVLYASVSSIDPSKAGRHQQRREDPETDYATVAPQQRGRPSSSLTPDQMSASLLKDPKVQAYAEEVVHWGQVVYGNDKLFQQRLQEILKDPSKGKELSDQLAEEPESMGKLAGRQALGMKSQTRKAAEDGFKPLVDAIDGYTKSVEEARERLLQTPHAEQRRHQEHSQHAERSHHHHHHHHHHHRHHERGQEQNNPEQSQQRQRHGERGMAYAM